MVDSSSSEFFIIHPHNQGHYLALRLYDETWWYLARRDFILYTVSISKNPPYDVLRVDNRSPSLNTKFSEFAWILQRPS